MMNSTMQVVVGPYFMLSSFAANRVTDVRLRVAHLSCVACLLTFGGQRRKIADKPGLSKREKKCFD